MKSDKRTGLESRSAGSRLICAVSGLSLMALAGSAPAQLSDNRSYLPPPAQKKSEPPKSETTTPAPKRSYLPPPPPKKTKAAPGQPGLSEPSAAVLPSEPVTPVTPLDLTTIPASGDSGIAPLKVRNHEVSVSTDFSFGFGQVTLPIAYSLNESLKNLGNTAPDKEAVSADRESIYFGGTVSYSYKQLAIDFSYAQGSSSGDVDIDTKGLGDLPAHFSIDDEWYQLYLRYAFPGRGGKFSSYLRAGATIVKADLEASAVSPVVGSYRQEDSTDDILGNVGFGALYYFVKTSKVRFGLQGEGEGFFGYRSQDSLERLQQIRGIPFKEETIDNTLYGGIARVTASFQYNFGRSLAFRAFAEGGAQIKYTIIDYPSADAPDEFLYGPYVKVGVRYAF